MPRVTAMRNKVSVAWQPEDTVTYTLCGNKKHLHLFTDNKSCWNEQSSLQDLSCILSAGLSWQGEKKRDTYRLLIITEDTSDPHLILDENNLNRSQKKKVPYVLLCKCVYKKTFRVETSHENKQTGMSPALALQEDGNIGGRQCRAKPGRPGVEPSQQFPGVRNIVLFWFIFYWKLDSYAYIFFKEAMFWGTIISMFKMYVNTV